MTPRPSAVALAAVLLAGGLRPASVQACGACFSTPAPGMTAAPQIVTGHRMVMSIGATESVLWDQFRYAGNPAEFAWVLPVSGEVRIEIASDAFFDELERTTTPTVRSPQVTFYCPRPGGGGGGGGGAYWSGCGCSEGAVAADAGAFGDAGPGGTTNQQDPVTVLAQQVVGPYETVTLRSTDTAALTNWLLANGYAIPPDAGPTLAYYNSLHMDFVALRLRPGEGIQAMQPVRLRYSGAQTVLPLRMVGIGAGDSVAITLWVFGRGRYAPANFPSATVDTTQLVWDFGAQRSNYNTLFSQTQSGRTWVTEWARQYERAYSGPRTPTDAGVVAQDAGNSPTSELDWGIATMGWQPNVWISRLRTSLRAADLDVDLQLSSASQNVEVPGSYTATLWRGVAPRPPCAGGFSQVDGRQVSAAPSRRRRPGRPALAAVALAIPFALGARRRRRRRNAE